jgi:hypothetical protein
MFDAILSEVFGIFQLPSMWLFFLLFFLFILVAYKVVKFLIRALIIAVVAGVFPIFANRFLGMAIPITLQNVVWFAITGVEIYFVYVILCSIGKLAEIVMKPFSGKKTKKVEKIIIMEKGKDKYEKKRRKEE